MVLFSEMVGYTSFKDEVPVPIAGEAEVTTTKRNGRTKVIMKADNSAYWVDTALIPDETSIVAEITDEAGKPETTDNQKDEVETKDLKNDEVVDSIVHIVRRGDTIQSIAEQYNVSVPAVINASGCDMVYVGQLIILPRG